MRFRDFHRNVQVRIGLSFLSGTANNMVLPFMSIYFSGKLGDTLAGLVVILGILAGVVAGIIGGYYSDRFGRKKLMLAAEIGWMLCFLLMAAANSPWWESPIATFNLMIIVSICWGIHGPANEAMLLDATQPEERKFMYAIMYWVNNLSFAIAGMAGAFLFKSYLFELFIALSVIGLITGIVTYVFIQDDYKPQIMAKSNKTKGKRPSIWTNYRQVLLDKTFLIFTIASLLLVSVEFHLGNYVAVRLGKEMIDAPFLPWLTNAWRIDGFQMLGFIRTENTVLVVVLSVFMGVLMRRFKDRNVLFIGYACYIAGYSYLAYSNHPALLLLSMLIATIGELMYVPIKQAYLGNMAPDHSRSSYMALYGMVYRGATFLGGLGVILGGMLSSWLMASLIAISGVIGMGMFYSILSQLEERKQGYFAAANSSFMEANKAGLDSTS
ncbi:MFS transporter [Paenibacillus qinlingensis]|uniref:DHA1 family multidrug resistance protein B-like MFS transporter n=1 Tax=Paenibacillus qinlingensis TaxID=1837343 RepID=A0ABU1NQJ9_9BACL|nr:MFS transporter [Paenibacillus qinlingensis]MDR6549744.1 DHA1 family multidrug resistance protein B-like MFS transporter [Paenibacillus qinlingensis]